MRLLAFYDNRYIPTSQRDLEPEATTQESPIWEENPSTSW